MKQRYRSVLTTCIQVGLACLLIFSTLEGLAQLNPLAWQYFNNPYLANPAMAGASDGLNVSLVHRKQWGSIEGMPSTQSLSADYRTGRKAAFGFNLWNDRAGLLKRTRMAGTYAYHLPLNDKKGTVHFGLSAALMYERIVEEDLEAEAGDILVGRFNERKTYFDADGGIAFTNRHISAQLSVPNLKEFFDQDFHSSVDQSVFFSSFSYKLKYGSGLSGFTVEPLVAFRAIKGNADLWDAGANVLVANELVSLTGLYHNTGSFTVGTSVNVESVTVGLLFSTETSGLKDYTRGGFELAVKTNLRKRK
jgi:type IX secretion system PorP/SprF family membrane protein